MGDGAQVGIALFSILRGKRMLKADRSLVAESPDEWTEETEEASWAPGQALGSP